MASSYGSTIATAVFVFVFTLTTSTTFASRTFVWTDQTAAGSRNWQSITSSADGTKLAAAVWQSPTFGVSNGSFGDIYTSTDGGVTWTDRTTAGTRGWQSITSSADGTKLAATVDCGSVASPGYCYTGGDIYTSTNSGATWTNDTTGTGASGWFWGPITSSFDGTKLAAASQGDINGNNAYVYTSTNSGATWTQRSPATNVYFDWNSITSSADGTKLAVAADFNSNTGDCSSGCDIYTSTDGGATCRETSAAVAPCKCAAWWRHFGNCFIQGSLSPLARFRT